MFARAGSYSQAATRSPICLLPHFETVFLMLLKYFAVSPSYHFIAIMLYTCMMSGQTACSLLVFKHTIVPKGDEYQYFLLT